MIAYPTVFSRRKSAPSKPSATASRALRLATLDARPMISRAEEPLDTILSQLDRLGSGGVLELITPFRPAPLIALLESSGHAVASIQLEPKLWSTEIVCGGEPAIDDLSDLEPPEPLQRVLERGESLGAADVYLARLPRYPRLLAAQLAARDLAWEIHEKHDGSALVRLCKPR